MNLFAVAGRAVADGNRKRRRRSKVLPYEVEDISDAMRALRVWNRPGKLHLYLVDREDQMYHERHIRFSYGAAIKLGAGVDRFRANSSGGLANPLEYQWVHPGDGLNQNEEAERKAMESARHWVLASREDGFRPVP